MTSLKAADKPLIEELPELYIHKCIGCDMLFNDVVEAEWLGFSNYTSYKMGFRFNDEIYAASMCKKCLKESIAQKIEKLKTVSDPFIDDRLAIGMDK